MKVLLTLVAFCALNVQAQVLIYKRTIHSMQMGNGFTFKSTVVGYLIVDASTGSAAEFDIDSRAKEFLNRSKTFTVGVVRGGGGKDHMVVADVLAGTDNVLGPYKGSLTARGTSVSIDVGLAGNRPAARTMRVIQRDVYFMVTEPFIDERAGSLVIDLAATRGANSAGQTVDDVVATMRSSLAAKGYRDSRPQSK